MPLYTVRTYKRCNGQPRLSTWSNTHHFFNAGAITAPAVAATVTALVDWEKTFHLTDVQFDRAVLSTYAKEGRKNHPEAFITIPLSGNGTSPYTKNDVTTDHLPLDHCLEVQYQGATGRPGKNLFRRCVSGFMWNDVGGSPSLEFAQLAEFLGLVSNGLDPGVVSQLRIVSPSAGPDTEGRAVSAVKCVGLASRQLKQPRRSKAQPTDDEGLGGLIDGIGLEIAKAVGTALVLKGAGKLISSPAALAAAERLGITAARLLPVLGPAL